MDSAYLLKRHNGQGPFGPVQTFVVERDGRKQIPRSLLRYLCTAPGDVEGQYGVDATPAQRTASEQRVQQRMAAFRERFSNVEVV